MAGLLRHHCRAGDSREQVSSIASGAMKYIAGPFGLAFSFGESVGARPGARMIARWGELLHVSFFVPAIHSFDARFTPKCNQ